MSDEARQAPVVSGSQVLAAGFASAGAALITSRFGVAGTLLGAALTTMIITGGSAILKAYLESVTGNVRKVPHKLRERRNRWKGGRSAEPDTMPGRPDLRDNLAGRMRAALGWFSHLPPLTRRSILIKGLVAAAVAFVIGMAAVYAVEKGIGNSLSCGIWANCPEGATPGVHLGGGDGTGAKSSFSLGRAKTRAAPGYEARDPAFQQKPFRQNPFQQNPFQQNPFQQNPAFQQEGPGRQQPAPSDNEPERGIFGPDRPVERESPAKPAKPSSASPAPDEQAPAKGEREPAQEVVPSDASPAPSE